MTDTSVANATTTIPPQPHNGNEELAAAENTAAIVIQCFALLFEFCILIPMIIALCKSYNIVYARSPPEQSESDKKNAQLLHTGRVCTTISILTYIVAGFFLLIQEIHEAPLIVDHLVYIFLILSYTFIFIALRCIGMEYFLTFISKYCDDHSINNQKRNEFERLFKGIYTAFGAFSVIYWFGYFIAICTNKNNFIVTAIGLGHIYLATICLLHGGMLHAMYTYKDDGNQSSRLLDNDQIQEQDANNENENANTMMKTIDLDEKQDENDIETQDEKYNLTEDNSNAIDNALTSLPDFKAMPIIKKWVIFFISCGLLLILEGISYAVAYSKNDGDFEFPEVHPFFLFTIFAFFGVMHCIFLKYIWIEY
eukprot:296522_1